MRVQNREQDYGTKKNDETRREKAHVSGARVLGATDTPWL